MSAPTLEVLAHVAANATGAWPELVRRTESKLRILLRFRMSEQLRSSCDEEDLLQEVWMEASQLLPRFDYRGPGSLQRWLAGILRNKIHRAQRTSRRLPATEARRSAADHPGRLDAVAQSQTGVSHEARRHEAEEGVRQVLAALPDDDREVVLLRVYEGLTGREAAARLGVDPSTVSYRFHKALRAMAGHLRDHA